MNTEKIIENLENIINQKYEPILIIKMMRLPSLPEMEGFRQYIKNEFGYNSLIFPGEMETDVKLISVLDSDKVKIEDLNLKIDDLIKRLESEVGYHKNKNNILLLIMKISNVYTLDIFIYI